MILRLRGTLIKWQRVFFFCPMGMLELNWSKISVFKQMKPQLYAFPTTKKEIFVKIRMAFLILAQCGLVPHSNLSPPPISMNHIKCTNVCSLYNVNYAQLCSVRSINCPNNSSIASNWKTQKASMNKFLSEKLIENILPNFLFRF